jgi:uncharacterized protein with von Willebrand factor type A (vWA) domain
VADTLVAQPDRLVVTFARALREAGIPVALGSTVTFARALELLDPGDRHEVYWAGRATLVYRPEDVAAYDRVFAATFGGGDDAGEPDVDTTTTTIELAFDDGSEGDDPGPDGDDESGDVPRITVRWSAHEVLRHRDFAAYTDAEFQEARRLMADLRLAGALRRSRRLEPVRRPVGRLDLRRSIRAALRAGGEPVRLRRRTASTRPRPVVLLCDVSGSMEPYARALLRFLHAAVVGRDRVEVFALGTRLTRITRELSSRDPDAALAAAALRVVDWSGGTRLGDGLREFNDRWGVRGMARGAVVVILSDGWDRGEPEVLGAQMQRLARVAHRVVWVNPLKATPEYAPVARGMAAALPYVDEFLEGHSFGSLEELARVVAR